MKYVDSLNPSVLTQKIQDEEAIQSNATACQPNSGQVRANYETPVHGLRQHRGIQTRFAFSWPERSENNKCNASQAVFLGVSPYNKYIACDASYPRIVHTVEDW